ncbi:class I SAM-dependent methyltransferase [Pannonibacter tanglangensis]|uniref:Methyltransferase domain-containing protein n=1 Tax=Pannonibacter tanglangensis TaxID=2750084 RepID=A0ABW9ZMD2_9HYPH|nr:methyltransferase domain-containing protein [Pannonibacter sp. XCT-34]NBN66026.1 methyltransferase domain-containing protein [Pannonibacter sp. XCT-34]
MAEMDLFDRTLLASRRRRALAARTDGADFLLAAVVEDLADRLAAVTRVFDTAVDLGGHTGRLTAALRDSGRASQVLRADLFLADPGLPPPDFICDDALLPLRDGSIGLIASALSLQLVNDLPGALIQIRRALQPDGLFLGAVLGGDTLAELRDCLMRAELDVTGGAGPRVAPFADTRDLGALLQRAGFALPVTDTDRLTVRYDSLFGLMQDLKAMGGTSVLTERSRKPLPRAVFLRAAELYARDHADADGRIRATFQIVYLSGWAPHKSQQKPLKPGSAQMRLADALAASPRQAGGNAAGD